MFEADNTRFPETKRRLKRKLTRICRMPKMSTMAIGGIINEGVRRLSPNQTFVNVGVWNGFSLFCGMLDNSGKTCIGIDNFSEFGGPKEAFYEKFRERGSPNHHFYEMDYSDYFLHVHDKPISFYIYDGNHTYQNQFLGLRLAEPFFAAGCHILIDDTNYEAVRRGTLDFVKDSTQDYRIILDERTYCNAHPTYWNGVMLLERTS